MIVDVLWYIRLDLGVSFRSNDSEDQQAAPCKSGDLTQVVASNDTDFQNLPELHLHENEARVEQCKAWEK